MSEKSRESYFYDEIRQSFHEGFACCLGVIVIVAVEERSQAALWGLDG